MEQQQIHAVQEFQGERVSFVAYPRAEAGSFSPQICAQLLQSGFLPHVAHRKEAQVAQEEAVAGGHPISPTQAWSDAAVVTFVPGSDEEQSEAVLRIREVRWKWWLLGL